MTLWPYDVHGIAFFKSLLRLNGYWKRGNAKNATCEKNTHGHIILKGTFVMNGIQRGHILSEKLEECSSEEFSAQPKKIVA
jgi:hypothetical protein